MSLTPYQQYKDSGVPWLASIPAHWQVQRLKHVIQSIDSGVSVNATDISAAEGEVGVLKTSCVYGGDFDASENKTVIPEEKDRVACPVKSGTLIVSRMNTPELVGAAGVVRQDHPNLYLPDRLWQVSFVEAHPSYIHYWTRTTAYRRQVEASCAGTSSSMQNLSQDDFRSFSLAFPSRTEQAAIATFLDHETAKIDALIAEQEKLRALLAEKRGAVISHAVTRGISDRPLMKVSGFAWLNDVPEHWEVTQLKRYCALITDGAHVSPETASGVYPFVSTKDISDAGIDFDQCLLTSEASYEYLERTGCRPLVDDVLFSKDGTIGRTVVVRENREFVVASSLIIIRPDPVSLNSNFLNYLCKSNVIAQQVESFVKGAGLPRLSINNLLKVFGVFPSKEEQATIAAFLDKETGKLDRLRDEAERVIGLLRERRAALITAAITGKIDVRNAVPDALAA